VGLRDKGGPMSIIVYDFDKTIYDGNSTLDFYFFCLIKQPTLVIYLPSQILAFILYCLRIYNKTRWKESFFGFLKRLKNNPVTITDFWMVHRKKIKKWYIEKDHSNDVIISASPEFLLKPACHTLHIRSLIASKVNQKTGKFIGNNCYGEEKVRRIKEDFGEEPITQFYSDSLSDAPLAQLAGRSFRVKKDRILPWP
jgi:HAD superfamily phosphoserine phosphatase-like hydrolase